ncbi:hypothetical protein [Salipiger bermudensis]|uniref:hypothetical protein n=1 Tax=Salipiger bermudensis TaxID=344736 RepID=UPI001CD7FC7F|nr:hypothetical protein [Salipiger bermudensis]MCA0964985.1 hypothetical protein [Salipiger bermudensis]
MVKPTNPEQHELHDRPMYGPKNPEIANMVERLAYDHGIELPRICRRLQHLEPPPDLLEAKSGKSA